MAKNLIDPENRFAHIIAPVVEDAGFILVRSALTSTKLEGQILQVMIEKEDGTQPTIDDCTGISRSLSALFDVEDPISGKYRLEVSSPGIDRPLTRLSDFERFKGEKAKIELNDPTITGQRKFRGQIIGCDGTNITITTDQGEEAIEFSNIVKASLDIADTLFKKSTPKSKDKKRRA